MSEPTEPAPREPSDSATVDQHALTAPATDLQPALAVRETAVGETCEASSPSQSATVAPDPAVAGKPGPGLATTEAGPPAKVLPSAAGATATAFHGDHTTEPAGSASFVLSTPGPRSPAPGPFVPGHEILEEIARGGMGVVYKARNIRLDLPVALKMVLSGAHASREQLERFATEAQAVAHLQHPGIVRIYEVGEHEGLPYFSLEFVAGGSLAQQIQGQPQSPRQAAELVHDLALAMREAHDHNIIHRDLKPTNVLIAPDGRPKITDFGLAKRLDSHSDVTRTGAIMGTPCYMAPEQAWGKTHDVGPWSDQYALGAILYEMLVGRPPFQGATPLETLQLVRTQECIPPTQFQPKIPVDLETICLKCLQKEPARRYADVAKLADDLQRFLEGRPIEARPVGNFERLVRWCRRNPRIAAMLGTIAVLLFLGTTGATAAAVHFQWLSGKLRQANHAESIARSQAEINERAAIAARNQAEKLVMVAFDQNRNSLESLRYLSVLAYQRLRDIPGTQEVREELLATSTKALRQNVEVMEQLAAVVRDREGAALAMRTMAGINQRAGKLMEEVQRYDEATTYFHEMDRLAEAMAAENPGLIEARKVLAASKATFGDFEMNRLADSKAALGHYEQNLTIRRELLEKNRADDEARRGVCNALGALAATWLKLGDPGKARGYYLQEIPLREQIAGDVAGEIEPRRERAGLEEKLGDLSVALDDNTDGRLHYDRALTLREEIAAQHPDHTQAQRDLLLSYNKIGTFALLRLNDAIRARSLHEKALAGFQGRLEADRQNVVANEDVALTQYYVATACLRAGDRKAAVEHYRACLELREALVNKPEAKVNAIDLMIARARCGQHARAAEQAEELMKTPPRDARNYFQYACGFALCAGAVAEAPDTKALVRHYTDRALDALRHALAAGWKNLTDVQTDPDLDPIRNDPGFAAVVADFRKASGM